MGDENNYYEQEKQEMIKLITELQDKKLITMLYFFIKKLLNNIKE